MGQQPRKQRGFTLIELMIASLLGLIVIATVTGVFISTYQANSQNLKVVRMDQEMRAAMTLMARDIRRAGAWELVWSTSLGSPNLFGTDVEWEAVPPPPANSTCLVFAYENAVNYSVTTGPFNAADDQIGYRLTSTAPPVGRVQMLRGTGSCASGSWQGITDEDAWVVTNLTFSTTLEPGVTGVGIRTVIVTLDGAVNTRASDPTRDAGGVVLDAADCAGNTLDIVCRRLVEKVRIRNDAIL